MRKQQSTEFGDLVRKLRLGLGLSLRRFAELVGISPTYASQIEKGKLPPPPLDRIRAMAKVLEYPENELIALAGRVPEDLPNIIRERPAEMAAIIRAAGELTTPQLEKLTKQAERLSRYV